VTAPLSLRARSQPERMAIFVQSSDVKGTMLRSVRDFAGVAEERKADPSTALGMTTTEK
jgi:hypothetical protein